MSFGARMRPVGAAERVAERSVVDWQARCTGCPPGAKTSFFLRAVPQTACSRA
jgi:hypothetical protein